MANRIEEAKNYKDKLVKDLGVWAEDPRLIATVNAKAERVFDTLAHMDRALPHETQTTDMKQGEIYKL